jgi:hypothetical protein
MDEAAIEPHITTTTTETGEEGWKKTPNKPRSEGKLAGWSAIGGSPMLTEGRYAARYFPYRERCPGYQLIPLYCNL